jgi:hypothetical protein
MDDLGFIAASYLLAVGGMVVLGGWILRRGRKLAAGLPDEDKPWT